MRNLNSRLFFKKILSTGLSLLIVLYSFQANAFLSSGRVEKVQCKQLFEPQNSFELINQLNRENNNFLGLEDYNEHTYSKFRWINDYKKKKLVRDLSQLDLNRIHTNRELRQWVLKSFDKLSVLTHENQPLRRRAQAELLYHGFNDYFQTQKLPLDLRYKVRRTLETMFQNTVTKWLVLPLQFPALEPSLMGQEISKKIIFEGYNSGSADDMALLKNSNKYEKYNRFAQSYNKIAVIVSSITISVFTAHMYQQTNEALVQKSQASVETSEAINTKLSQLENINWKDTQSQLLYAHSKAVLENKLGRNLTAEEESQLLAFMQSQN